MIYVYNGPGASSFFAEQLIECLRDNVNSEKHVVKTLETRDIDEIADEEKGKYYFLIPGGNVYGMSKGIDNKRIIKNAAGVIGFCAGAVLLHAGFCGSRITESLKEQKSVTFGYNFIRGMCENPPYDIYADLTKNFKAVPLSGSDPSAVKTNNLYVLWAGGPKLPEEDNELEVIARYAKAGKNGAAAIARKGKFIASAVHPEFDVEKALRTYEISDKLKKSCQKLALDEPKRKELFRSLLKKINICLN